LNELTRARILDALVGVVYERGYAGATVTSVCARAKVSRQTFYSMFGGLEDCFLAVIDDGYRHVRDLIATAFEQAQCWQEGVRGALAGLLSFFDAEPRLARVWLVETLATGAWALERRERNLAALTELIVGYWPAPPGFKSHPLAAPGVMASVLDVLQRKLLAGESEPLISLLGPLMGVACAPYLDAAGVRAEVERAQALARETIAKGPRAPRARIEQAAIPEVLSDPRARRARRCLLYVAERPGASNRQIGEGIGVASQTQISSLLARLEGLGLLVKHAGRAGHPNAWSLSAYGGEVAGELARRPLDTLTNNTAGTREDG